MQKLIPLLALALLQGCGMKGDLYEPAPAAEPVSAPAEPDEGDRKSIPAEPDPALAK